MNKKTGKKSLFVYISKVFSWFLLTLLVLIAAFLVYYVVAANIYARKGEEFKPKFSMYTIISPSMTPTIRVYDVIFNMRVDDVKTLKEGDVITFISSGILNEGMTVTHRIVGIVETSEGIKFRTKGDNNISPDTALVEPENVLGVTLFKIPQLGRVQSLLATRGGWIFIVLLPALVIIIMDILKLFKLIGVKNKVNQSILDNEVKIDPEQIRKEEERKEEIRNKLFKKEETEEVVSEPVVVSDVVEEEKTEMVRKETNTSKNTSKNSTKPRTKKTTKTTTKGKSSSSKSKASKSKTTKSTKKPQVVKMDVELPKKKK